MNIQSPARAVPRHALHSRCRTVQRVAPSEPAQIFPPEASPRTLAEAPVAAPGPPRAPAHHAGGRQAEPTGAPERSLLTAYSFGVVVLTQGERPEDLKRAVDSVLAQQGVDLDVVCVGNGWQPTGLPAQVKTLALPRNVGIPAGRNAGAPHVAGEFIFFLDDDAWLPDQTTFMRMAELMRSRPSIGLIQPRVEDPDGPQAPRRWIPRLYKRSPEYSSNVFSVWEGAVCLQRRAFEAVAGWSAPYWYMHEGIELAWRMWDAGFHVWYMGDLAAAHPVTDQRRHEAYCFLNARNRVWLARRNLPWPLGLAYVGSWTLMHLVGWATKPGQLGPWFQGWLTGWAENPWQEDEAPRKLSAAGVVRMARHGRLPIV